MNQSKFFNVYDENNIRFFVFVPTGEILLKFVMLPQMSVIDNIRLTEVLLQGYEDYIKLLWKRQKSKKYQNTNNLVYCIVIKENEPEEKNKVAQYQNGMEREKSASK